MIRHMSFDHGWYYFYRVHEEKLVNLAQTFPLLAQYLYSLFEFCPNEYFRVEPRSSHLRFPMRDVALHSILNHEVCALASVGLDVNEDRYASNHSKVQVFMLENDASTIAIEVPLWLTANEWSQYPTFFSTDSPLTGHIDVLRVENGKIWVWDYKPSASCEKFAATQVYFYALMLSKRTGIPLNQFSCGYFDGSVAYTFDPVCCIPMPMLNKHHKTY